MFKPVDQKPDFSALENQHLKRWYESGIVKKYLAKNSASEKYYSFIDGPITANNPMGVHHAWGRTYKDLWRRFFNLLGYKQTFHNGFDCQGLWVEVEVEKELALKSKKDIENIVPGDRKASIDRFVELCKERVLKFAAIQTEQTKRLGNFMDWDNSYFTMSDDNNFMIWRFLKNCFENGWMYKGNDSVPWCPRCETAISQHEMLTEDYKEMTHESVFVKFPVVTEGWDKTSLLIWTTTPWSVPANVVVGINKKYTYGIWRSKNTGEKIIILAKDQEGNVPHRPHKKTTLPIHEFVFHGVDDEFELVKEVSAEELLGLKYEAPYDDLERVKTARDEHPDTFHTVVDASEIVTSEEGTGLLHVAPSAGGEDFKLSKEQNLSVIPVLADDASYLDGLGELSGKSGKAHPEMIIDFLRANNWLFKSLQYTHRYPACWRCKKELVWKVTDEWYLSMDTPSKAHHEGKTFRELMIGTAQKITWMPEFGLERELDWLNNMHDWLISKKNRYWGLALPIYECTECETFTVIGSKEELQEKAQNGWAEFEGHSPHKPWIDAVTISCPHCGKETSRIDDVGNVWLDAGIVPYSTIKENNQGEPLYTKDKAEWEKWFPADFITESFPGQFKNWFYAMIAMSSALENREPFKRVLGYATALAEDGRPMHKSWGNSIEFNEGAEKIGADVMRWMFARQNPSENMLFGYKRADEVRRQFILMLWNIYRFFIEYRELDVKDDAVFTQDLHISQVTNVLDLWILHHFVDTESQSKKFLEEYNPRMMTEKVETFVNDLSTWFIRRSRDRVWVNSDDEQDKLSFYKTLYFILKNLMIVISPVTPFLSDEIFINLTDKESVHLENWPDTAVLLGIQEIDEDLLTDMKALRSIVEVGHRERKLLSMKVRQPLQAVTITVPDEMSFLKSDHAREYKNLIAEELNVKEVEITAFQTANQEITAQFDTNISPELQQEGEVRDLIRSIQELRKSEGLQQHDRISLTLPKEYSPEHRELIKRRVMAETIEQGAALEIKKL